MQQPRAVSLNRRATAADHEHRTQCCLLYWLFDNNRTCIKMVARFAAQLQMHVSTCVSKWSMCLRVCLLAQALAQDFVCCCRPCTQIRLWPPMPAAHSMQQRNLCPDKTIWVPPTVQQRDALLGVSTIGFNMNKKHPDIGKPVAS